MIPFCLDPVELRALLFKVCGVTVRVVCSEVPLPNLLNRQEGFSTQSLDDDTTVDIYNTKNRHISE